MTRNTTKTTDLTQGPIFRSMTLFALPMLCGNILQQLYNIVDTWAVGRFIGTEALGAVGSVYSLTVFLTSVLLGLCLGSGAVFSQCFGRKEYEVLERRIGTAFTGIAVIAILITLISYILCGRILQWLNIPEEMQPLTGEYLLIILIGIPAVFLYNFFAGYLKSAGDSLTPLLFLAVSSLTNIVLDLVLIIQFGKGIAGAAAATVTAQYLSGILTAAYCLKKDIHIRNAFRHPVILKENIRILGSYSFYTCLQQSVMNLGILTVQGIVNSFGVQVMAAFSTGVKIDSFAYMPAQEYGNAFSTFLAQNYGAGKKDRIDRGMKIGIATVSAYCLTASAVLYFLAEPLLGIFISGTETEVLEIGIQYLHIEGLFYIGIGILFLWYGYYRAVGKPQMSLVLTIISLGTRVILAWISAHTSLGITGVWQAIPIGWGLADLAGYLYYRFNVSNTMQKESTCHF